MLANKDAYRRETLIEWLPLGPKVNSDKLKIVIFTRGKNQKFTAKFTFNNKDIEIVFEYKIHSLDILDLDNTFHCSWIKYVFKMH